MIVRGFGRSAVDETGQIHTAALVDDRPPSTFPPALLEENRAAIARRRAELHAHAEDAAE